MNFLSALSFLTVIPVPKSAFRDDGRQILYFPLIGLLLGALLWGVDSLCAVWVTQEIRIVADVLFLAVITGALHLDGLADSADGLFAHRSREKALEIMKDPRIGVMGTLAVIFCLSLKMAGLAGLPEENRGVWLMAAPALARTSQVIGLVFMDYARKNEGKSGLFFQKGKLSLLSLGIVPLTFPFLISIQAGIMATGFFLFITVLLLWFFQKKIAGITGDTLGALTEIVEASVFIAGAVAAQNF